MIVVGLLDRLLAQHEHYNDIMRTMAAQEGRTAAVDEGDAAVVTEQMGGLRADQTTGCPLARQSSSSPNR